MIMGTTQPNSSKKAVNTSLDMQPYEPQVKAIQRPPSNLSSSNQEVLRISNNSVTNKSEQGREGGNPPHLTPVSTKDNLQEGEQKKMDYLKYFDN